MTLISFNRRRFLQVGAAGIAVVATGRRASAAETLPKQIRFFGNPADYGQPFTTGILGIAHSGGFFAKEFEKDDVELTFTYPAGSGPAINEAIANGQVDFARYGGFPHITGKSRGLPTKLLASVGIGHSYLVVRNGLDVKTVADLKGLRAAIGRGTAPHLAFIRVLEQHGLKEADVELFDLEGGDEIGAIASGAVDIGWGGAGFLKLAEDGNAKLIYKLDMFQRLVDMVPSPNSCIDLCLGTMQEMDDGEVYPTIASLSKQDKVAYVHLRNVRGKVPHYEEVFLDEGDLDVVKALMTLRGNGFDGPVVPDHVPNMSTKDPWHSSMAYALGYIKAVMQQLGVAE